MKVSGKSLVILALILGVLAAQGIWAKGQGEAGGKAQVAPGPWGKYSPALEITTVTNPKDPRYYGPGNTDTDNPWMRAYLDRLGIKAKLLWVSDQYDTKLNLAIAAGELPDFFKVNAVQFGQLVDAGVIQPLDEAYKYASPDTINVIDKEGGSIPRAAATVKGQLMAIPWILGRETLQQLWLRTDWMQKLGLADPKGMAELQSIMEAFVAKDPDGNGKADTIGFPLTKNLYDIWGKGFFNSYGAFVQTWLKDPATGKLVYGSVQPAMKDALAALQDLYKRGILDRQFAVIEASKATEPIAAGKAGVHFGEFHSVVQTVRDNDKTADFKAIPLVAAGGGPAKVQLGDMLNGYWVVRKGYKNPEAMIKMLNLWMENFYFPSDQAYKDYSQGPTGAGMWQASLIFSYRGFKNVANAEAVSAIVAGTKTRDQVNPEQRGVYDQVVDFMKNGNQARWRYTRIFGPNGSMLNVPKYYAANLVVENQFYTSPTPAMTAKWSTLEDKILESCTKIVMGDPIGDFDKLVATWKSLGGDEVTAEVNKWYDSRK